ncbi:hypothetical protein F4W70_21895 [Pseudomonas cannabina]|nr:hypothetical protein F4W70_21895 [Pseudomonas cannabina]
MILSTPSREGLKKPFLQKSKPVNTGAPARFLSKKMGFFRGYLARQTSAKTCRQSWPWLSPVILNADSVLVRHQHGDC